MKEIRTELEILAAPPAVWRVLSDFERYAEWNPFIVQIRARLEPGASVDFTAKLGRRPVPIAARMVEVDEPRGFWWRGPRSAVLGKLFTGEHYFEIHSAGADRSRFVHGERFRGWLVPALARQLDRRLVPAYEAMNRALKNRVEAG